MEENNTEPDNLEGNESKLLAGIRLSQAHDTRRKLSYFGHRDDGKGTFKIRHMKYPTFLYRSEIPLDQRVKNRVEEEKVRVHRMLTLKGDGNLDRFLVVPERKNVWMGGIRSQCEGILSAKTYKSKDDDKGVYTVIPEIPGAKVSVDAVYKMWLALENAMIRQESLIIVEDPALAHVTKFRTEQWNIQNNMVHFGSFFTVLNAFFFYKFPCMFLFPFCLGLYGNMMLAIKGKKDPAINYSECVVNKLYEVDPDSFVVCDAQISMRYLRSPSYRMFKLENYKARMKRNQTFLSIAFVSGAIALLTNVYNLPFRHEISHRGFESLTLVPTGEPLNIFEQLRSRFLLFGRTTAPGRCDVVHWLIKSFLLYYLILRHIPWAIQSILEYTEREYIMETSIRYLQFRNLQGDERYEFPARNLYNTMQKDYPENRILKEMYDHYNQPPEGYYESAQFLETRESHEVTLKEAIRRAKISYYRNW